MTSSCLSRLLAAGLCLVSAAPAVASDFTIQNTRAAGFADATPATPLAMNPGTNRGDQALIVFQAAGAMWGATVRSEVPILIDSEFDSAASNTLFTCTSDGTVLAYTTPAGAETGTSYPNPSAAYVIPLANAMAGHDLWSGAPQFQVNINGDLGTNRCSFPAGWYFGLDALIPDSSISLFTTLMHEFGHGLGYFSFVDPSSGAGDPLAIFDYHIIDLATGATWVNNSVSQRKQLIVTPSSIAFDGDAVRADIPNFLAPMPTLVTSFQAASTTRPCSPYDVFGSGVGTCTGAQFSGPLEGTGQLVQANPLDACSDLTNASDVAGKFALIERSFADAGVVCTFLSKAERAADAGAIGVIVFDNTDEPLIFMSGAPQLSIPSTFISNADGTTLQGQLGQGPPVTVSFGTTPEPSNTDPSGTRVLLYTPNQVASGSSVSHWNANSYPHTLMLEFANQPDIRLNMDFTPDVMADIGWSVITGLGVSVVKLLDPEVPAGGQSFYLTAVINRRSTPISTVTLDVALPEGTTFISNASAPAGCATAFPCTLQSLQPGQVVLVVTTVQVPTNAPNPFVVTATATPSSPNANDSLTATSTQTTALGGDLQVTITPPSTLAAGASVVLTTTVTNPGPGDAAGVVLTGAVTGSSASPPGFQYNNGDCSTAFPCSLGTLAKGQSVFVTSTFAIPAGFQSGGASFTATVTSVTPDINTANNSASFTFNLGSTGGGCSSSGGASTALGVLGLIWVLAIRRRDTF